MRYLVTVSGGMKTSSFQDQLLIVSLLASVKIFMIILLCTSREIFWVSILGVLRIWGKFSILEKIYCYQSKYKNILSSLPDLSYFVKCLSYDAFDLVRILYKKHRIWLHYLGFVFMELKWSMTILNYILRTITFQVILNRTFRIFITQSIQ